MKNIKRSVTKLFFICLVSLFPIFNATLDSASLAESGQKKLSFMGKKAMLYGETLDFILQEMDIENNERYRITESLKNHLSMKTCMPGDSVYVFKNIKGDFVKLEYAKSSFLKFTVTKMDTLYKTVKIETAPSIAICYAEGTISSSLYESIIKMGESAELVFDFADIFAWTIDFLTEVQPGDTFEIIFEKEFCKNHYIKNGKIIGAVYKGAMGDYFAYYFKDPDKREDYYDENGNSLRKQLLKAPLQYRRISSCFSLHRRHPILKIVRPHYGVDFAAPRGTPVCSVGDGHIVFAGWKGGYGNFIEIKHPNSFKTYYGHLSRIKKGMVKGVKVKQGEVIGYVGSTGLSTGPHLHFGIRKYGKWVNPLKIDLPPAEPINEKYKELYMKQVDNLRDKIEGSRRL